MTCPPVAQISPYPGKSLLAGLRAIPLGVAHFAMNALTWGRAVVGWSGVAKPQAMNAPYPGDLDDADR